MRLSTLAGCTLVAAVGAVCLPTLVVGAASIAVVLLALACVAATFAPLLPQQPTGPCEQAVGSCRSRTAAGPGERLDVVG